MSEPVQTKRSPVPKIISVLVLCAVDVFLFRSELFNGGSLTLRTALIMLVILIPACLCFLVLCQWFTLRLALVQTALCVLHLRFFIFPGYSDDLLITSSGPLRFLDTVLRLSDLSQWLLLGFLTWMVAVYEFYSRYEKFYNILVDAHKDPSHKADLSHLWGTCGMVLRIVGTTENGTKDIPLKMRLQIFSSTMPSVYKALFWALVWVLVCLIICACLPAATPLIYISVLPGMLMLLSWLGECVAEMMNTFAASRKSRFTRDDIVWIVMLIFCLFAAKVF